MTLQPGLRAAFRYTVTEADTAVALGSGEVPVLAVGDREGCGWLIVKSAQPRLRA